MNLKMKCIACALLVPALGVCKAQAPKTGCRLEREEHFQCNRDAFAKRLAQAHLIRVDAGRMDLYAREHTGQLVEKLGKQIADQEQRPDLVFEIDAIDRNGRINVGPGDIPLVRLNIYDPSVSDRHLVWVETLDGQPDLPWPAEINELLKRFQQHVAGE